MERQVIVIGLGRFGMALARALFEMGHQVLAVDKNEYVLGEAAECATHVAQADGSDRAAMDELGIRNFDAAFVAVSASLESSILTTLNLKELGVPFIIARASSPQHAAILTRIGADKVVSAELETAITLAHTFAVPSAVDYMPLGADYGVAKIAAPQALVGKSLAEASLFEDYGVRLIAICRTTGILLHPRLDEHIMDGDLLVLAGQDESMERIRD